MVFGGDNAESYYDDGLTASMKGDLQRAIRCFEKAIRLDQTFAAAYHQIAKCYLRMGRGQQAVEVLRQVVTKRPELAAARLDLGHALLKVGQVAEARQQFQQLVALDPNNGRAQLGVAQSFFDEGQGLAAVDQAQKAIAVGGANFAALFLLGRAAKLAGDSVLATTTLERADKIIEKSLDTNAEGPEPLFLRGEVAFARDQFSTALELYRDARDKTDRDNRARVYSAYGENFSHTDVLAKIGLCFHRLGKTDRAKEIGREILDEDPNHALGKSLADLDA